MTLQIEVNVMGFVTKDPTPSKDYYTGDFIFQQIAPTDQIFVDRDGNVNLQHAPLGAVEIRFRWLSPQVEIDGTLYPAAYSTTPEDNFWVREKKNKPNKGDGPPAGGQFSVTLEPPNVLVVTDDNSDGEFYTYSLAVQVGIDGGEAFAADPRITNKGTNRFFSLESGC